MIFFTAIPQEGFAWSGKRAGVELKSLPLGRVYEQNYTNPRQCGRP
jgi:hypothetical protein